MGAEVNSNNATVVDPKQLYEGVINQMPSQAEKDEVNGVAHKSLNELKAKGFYQGPNATDASNREFVREVQSYVAELYIADRSGAKLPSDGAEKHFVAVAPVVKDIVDQAKKEVDQAAYTKADLRFQAIGNALGDDKAAEMQTVLREAGKRYYGDASNNPAHANKDLVDDAQLRNYIADKFSGEKPGPSHYKPDIIKAVDVEMQAQKAKEVSSSADQNNIAQTIADAMNKAGYRVHEQMPAVNRQQEMINA